jgi:hypothetical protein
LKAEWRYVSAIVLGVGYSAEFCTPIESSCTEKSEFVHLLKKWADCGGLVAMMKLARRLCGVFFPHVVIIFIVILSFSIREIFCGFSPYGMSVRS